MGVEGEMPNARAEQGGGQHEFGGETVE